jgi:phage baseplate assembly protein W
MSTSYSAHTSLQNTKEFLGKGWKFPVRLNQNLNISTSLYEENIVESIKIILGTRKGERVMRPEFGCGIHDFVFESINAVSLGHIELSITEALIRYEPRIELMNVDISTDKIANGLLLISIHYRIISTNNTSNLVYPFYIKES